MDWCEDDEVRRQWEVVSKKEEQIVRGAQRVSELMTKEKDLKKKEGTGKMVGWST